MRLSALFSMMMVLGCAPQDAEQDPPKIVDTQPPEEPEVTPLPEPETTPETEEDQEPTFPLSGLRSRSGALLVAANSDVVMVTDSETGQLHLVHEEWRRTVDVGGEATRMVRIGDAVAITMRAEGEVAWFRMAQHDLEVGPRAVVGAEPFDVVASTAHNRLYVSLSVDDAVVELDAHTLAELRRWEISGEPRWMTVREGPAGEELFVSTARGEALTRIELSTGTAHTLALPTPARFTTDGCTDRRLHGRVTGELTIGLDAVYVPTLYVDPVLQTGPHDPPVDDPCLVASTDGGPGSRASSTFSDGESPERLWQAGRFNAVITAFDLDTLEPTLIDADSARTLFNSPVPTRAVRTYPTSVVVEEEAGADAALFVALEGSDSLVRIDMTSEVHESTSFVSYDRTAFPTHSDSVVRFDPDDPAVLWTWSWLDRTVRTYDREEMEALLILATNFGGFGFPLVPVPFTGAIQSLDVGYSSMPEEVRHGRNLFYNALTPGLSSVHAGVSCATCHAEGRSDGVTWQFTDRARQTPSLAGPIASTAPFGSDGSQATLQDMVRLSATQMGGEDLEDADAAAIAAYLDYTRDITSPEPVDAAQVALGAELFSRDDVGCSGCHTGARLTDNTNHAVLGGPETQTPSLIGLAGTGPYFLDGSAATLRDVLERAAQGDMGDTSMLDATELDALEAFLRSR